MSPPTTVAGTVKWYNVKRRFGFITRDDTQTDIYVHSSDISTHTPRKAVPSLADGERVVFTIKDTAKGPEATNVTGPGGNSVVGSDHTREKGRSTASVSGRQQSGSYDILDVVIRTAKVLAEGDTCYLRQLLPALLRENKLPVMAVPLHLPHRPKPRAPRTRPTNQPEPETTADTTAAGEEEQTLPEPHSPASSIDSNAVVDVEEESRDATANQSQPTTPPPQDAASSSTEDEDPTPPASPAETRQKAASKNIPNTQRMETWGEYTKYFERLVLDGHFQLRSNKPANFSLPEARYSHLVPHKYRRQYTSSCGSQSCTCTMHYRYVNGVITEWTWRHPQDLTHTNQVEQALAHRVPLPKNRRV